MNPMCLVLLITPALSATTVSFATSLVGAGPSAPYFETFTANSFSGTVDLVLNTLTSVPFNTFTILTGTGPDPGNLGGTLYTTLTFAGTTVDVGEKFLDVINGGSHALTVGGGTTSTYQPSGCSSNTCLSVTGQFAFPSLGFELDINIQEVDFGTVSANSIITKQLTATFFATSVPEPTSFLLLGSLSALMCGLSLVPGRARTVWFHSTLFVIPDGLTVGMPVCPSNLMVADRLGSATLTAVSMMVSGGLDVKGK
jgi:hypothetical protein